MNRFKLNALKQEFSFLKDTALLRRDGSERESDSLDGIVIKRITKDLLNHTPREHFWDGSLVGIEEWERVDFVLNDYNNPQNHIIVRDAVKCSGDSGSNYAHQGHYEWDGETILEAIDRLGMADTLLYIVISEGGYNIVEHHSQSNWRTTIYKPAKDFNIRDAISDARIAAFKEVSAEAAF